MNNCVACNSDQLELFLDLNNQPPANDYLENSSEYREFPLSINFCSNCFHSQLSYAVHPDLLFRNYFYVSGTTKTLDIYFDKFVEKMNQLVLPSRKVLEIASNDGTLLSKFQNSQWDALGVDPAINLIKESILAGVTTIPNYFNLELTKYLSKDFSLIVAMNVLAHTSDPIGILLAAKEVLLEDGIILIQTSQADMISDGQFDTAYHEHISFFNVKSMIKLLDRAGLFLSGIEIVPIHGNSYLWYVTKKPNSLGNIASVESRLALESKQGIYHRNTYLEFNERAKVLRESVRTEVMAYVNKKHKIVVYGVAAKGNTFINFCGIKIDEVYDDNQLKIGKISPICGCVVANPNALAMDDGDKLFIITAWNFAEEIIGKIRKLRPNSSDSYLIYYPVLKVGKIHD